MINNEQAIHSRLCLILKNENAVQMCLDLFKISQTWDDLHDGDPVDNDRLSEVFKTALVSLPDNPFYDKFRFQLRPLIMSTILQWESANSMEKLKQSPHKSYMLRAGIYSIFHMCVFLLHGPKIARKTGPAIYEIYGETPDNFLKGDENA